MSYLFDVEKMADAFAVALLQRDGLDLWGNEGIALAYESHKLARSYVEGRRAFSAAHRDGAADDGDEAPDAPEEQIA